MKKIDKYKLTTVIILVILIIGSILFSNIVDKKRSTTDFAGNYDFVKAQVNKISYDNTDDLKSRNDSVKQTKQEFQITILDGSHKGERYEIRNTVEAVDVHRMIVSEGDDILINYTIGSDGKMNSIHLYEIVRDKYLYLLSCIFVFSIILICGKKGIKSVIALFFAGYMIIMVLMPIIMAGFNSLITTIIICIITGTATIIFINGINKKAAVAIMGTVGGIIISAFIAVIIGHASKITGLTDHEMQMFAYTNRSINLDYRYLLFSAIIIGALGAIMDVSISICSAMSELIEIKPDINKKNLIKSGMNIGKDVMATMVNTLILAYAGGAFNLILLFKAERVSYTEIINLEIITTDIITALSGSIGLVWTIPVTVFAMAKLHNRSNSKIIKSNKRTLFPKMKKHISLIIIIFIIISLSSKIVYAEQFSNSNIKNEIKTVKAKVMKITYDDTSESIKEDMSNVAHRQEFQLIIEEGGHKGEKYTLKNTIEAIDVYNIKVHSGQHILVSIDEDENGKIIGMQLFDIYRENILYILLIIFFVLMLIVGRHKGLKSIFTLILTGIIVMKIILPSILKGSNPILITILCSIVIVCVTLLGLNGINKKTISSILGTLGGLFIAGIIALLAGNAAAVTGLADEEAQMLAFLQQNAHLNYQGILFAGIIIGALGAVMDVSISIASSMSEIIDIKPEITMKEYLKTGMNIGKDIMGTMSNTLILAYAGGSIQLILLFMAANTSLSQIMNLDSISGEIIRALAGSIGLVITIPMTVIICAFINKGRI